MRLQCPCPSPQALLSRLAECVCGGGLPTSQVGLEDPLSCRLLTQWDGTFWRRVSSPNASGDTREENGAGRLQAVAHLYRPIRVSVPGRSLAQEARPPQQQAGPQQAPGEMGRDLEGDSWLLNEPHGSPGPPGVLCLRFVLNRRLHRCVPPTQASRGLSWLGPHQGRPAEGQRCGHSPP